MRKEDIILIVLVAGILIVCCVIILFTLGEYNKTINQAEILCKNNNGLYSLNVGFYGSCLIKHDGFYKRYFYEYINNKMVLLK